MQLNEHSYSRAQPRGGTSLHHSQEHSFPTSRHPPLRMRMIFILIYFTAAMQVNLHASYMLITCCCVLLSNAPFWCRTGTHVSALCYRPPRPSHSQPITRSFSTTSLHLHAYYGALTTGISYVKRNSLGWKQRSAPRTGARTSACLTTKLLPCNIGAAETAAERAPRGTTPSQAAHAVTFYHATTKRVSSAPLASTLAIQICYWTGP
jgi:hypothetical protein